MPSAPGSRESLAAKALLLCGTRGSFLSHPIEGEPMGQSWLYQTPAVAALGFLGGAGAGSEAQDRLTQPRGDNFNLQPPD